MMDVEAVERLRLRLVDHQAEQRRRALAEAQALPEPERLQVVVACDISGQQPLSDEVVILLAQTWREWLLLTSLHLRGCQLLSRIGCEVIGRQGRITDLRIDGGTLIDDASLVALAALPLESFEIWEAKDVTAEGAMALAAIPTLRRLAWQNAPVDTSVTASIATSASITSLAYTGKGMGLQVLAPFARMQRLVELQLFGVDDSEVAAISRLPVLERLRLDHSAWVTDEGLAELRHLPHLRSFALTGAAITDAGVKTLAGLPGLEEIRLQGEGPMLTDEAAEALRRLPRLRRLEIIGRAAVTDAGVAHLGRLSQLETLWLHGCAGVGDDSMPHLAPLSLLSELDLSGTSVGDEGVDRLSGLPGLSVLSLYGTPITPAALRSLRPLTGLRRLDLRDCTGLAPIADEPWLGMPHLEDLQLQGAGPLDADQTRRLSQSCRSLRQLSCRLGGGEAFAPLVMLDRLWSLRIAGAAGLGDQELELVSRLRELASLVIVDAPWLTDRGIAVLEGLPSLRAIAIAGCPGMSPRALRRLATTQHLEHTGGIGRLALSRGTFVALRGQLISDGGDTFGGDLQGGATGDLPELVRSATQSNPPSERPADTGHRHARDLEAHAEAAIAALAAMGTTDAIAALEAALRVQPTRWAYAGWALVRLALSGSAAALAALERASEHPQDVDLRIRARRFLRHLDVSPRQ